MNQIKAKDLARTDVFYLMLNEINANQSTVWADIPKIGWMITYLGTIGMN